MYVWNTQWYMSSDDDWRAAEEIIVCLDALMFAKSILWMDCQLLNCSFLSAIISQLPESCR